VHGGTRQHSDTTHGRRKSLRRAAVEYGGMVWYHTIPYHCSSFLSPPGTSQLSVVGKGEPVCGKLVVVAALVVPLCLSRKVPYAFATCPLQGCSAYSHFPPISHKPYYTESTAAAEAKKKSLNTSDAHLDGAQFAPLTISYYCTRCKDK
jgi:hypothetical protein